MKTILVVNGTARADNQSAAVTKLLATKLAAAGANVHEVYAADHVTIPRTIPGWQEAENQAVYGPWRELVVGADLLVFVLPEYNHGYPGEWKLLMDALYQEYNGKQAALVGVSGSSFAGARVLENVLPVLAELQLQVRPERLYIGKVKSLLTETGEVADAAVAERVDNFVAALVQ